MMIVGVWLLRPALDYRALYKRLESKLLGYARFRQKVVQETLLTTWGDDDDFDLRRHVVREKLVRKRGQSERAALQMRAGALAVELARAGVQVLRDAAALALLPDDSPTLLKGKLNGKKVVAWCEPLPLDHVKAVGKVLNCSVNDVLLSCVAGSIGEYLRGRGEDPAGKEIRALVPVNLRPPQEAWQLGNRFGLVPLVLPIGIANPLERVYAVRERMHELKGSYQPLLAYALLTVSGVLTKSLQDDLSNLFLRKTTAVMTNVPGPAAPIKFCGSTLRQSIFWVPTSGDVGIGVGIVSYAGGVQFDLIADSRRCPDPQAIIDRFAPEFEELLLLTLMLPWLSEVSKLAVPMPLASGAQTSAT